MKKTVLFFIGLLFGLSLFSQDSKVSTTLSYPVTVGDNFLNEYTGYVDIGLQYRFLDINIVNVGISANVAIVGDEEETNRFASQKSGVLIYPRIFGELLLGRNGKLRPIFGVGYGANVFKEDVESFNSNTLETDGKRTLEGIILNAGISYDFSRKLFAIAQYDWAAINNNLAVDNDAYLSRGSLVKIGIGYRF